MYLTNITILLRHHVFQAISRTCGSRCFINVAYEQTCKISVDLISKFLANFPMVWLNKCLVTYSAEKHTLSDTKVAAQPGVQTCDLMGLLTITDPITVSDVNKQGGPLNLSNLLLRSVWVTTTYTTWSKRMMMLWYCHLDVTGDGDPHTQQRLSKNSCLRWWKLLTIHISSSGSQRYHYSYGPNFAHAY